MDGALLDPVRRARAMTRCECTGLRFEELVRRLREEGLSLEALQEKTGVGRLCTACVPDLCDHLAPGR